ncbi:hypothetical protein G6F56_011613 [Rhizopus delemar]|nr:hypothetical protein G6F56_011613 [Rhizopus delemar]
MNEDVASLQKEKDFAADEQLGRNKRPRCVKQQSSEYTGVPDLALKRSLKDYFGDVEHCEQMWDFTADFFSETNFIKAKNAIEGIENILLTDLNVKNTEEEIKASLVTPKLGTRLQNHYHNCERESRIAGTDIKEARITKGRRTSRKEKKFRLRMKKFDTYMQEFNEKYGQDVGVLVTNVLYMSDEDTDDEAERDVNGRKKVKKFRPLYRAKRVG